MKGLKLKKENNVWVLDTEAIVEGDDLLIQNAIVNIATIQGTDDVVPERGTDLAKELVQGSIHTKVEAQHACNFAALDTTIFMKDTAVTPEQKLLKKIYISEESMDFSTLNTTVIIERKDNTVQSVQTTL